MPEGDAAHDPKHKGTERIQADIKSRIKQFSDELIGPRKGPVQVGSAHSVHREGAAHVGLIGPPNSGKSSLHAILTGSRAEIGPFPYTTRAPLPGMLPFEDIAFQLVDLPPMSSARTEPWMAGVLQTVDAAWLVVDLADPAYAEHLLAIRTELAQRKITLTDRWPGLTAYPDSAPASRAEPDEARSAGGDRPVPGSAPRTPHRAQERSRPRPQRGAGA